MKKKCKNKKQIQKWKNRIIPLSLFSYLKFRNSEISAVLHLVVPNVDSHPMIFPRYYQKSFSFKNLNNINLKNSQYPASISGYPLTEQHRISGEFTTRHIPIVNKLYSIYRFSAFWAFLYFVGFCYLTNAWNKSEDPKDGYGVNNVQAAIAFCFFSMFTWVTTTKQKSPQSFTDPTR